MLENFTDRKIFEEQLQVALRDQQTLFETMSVGVAQTMSGKILLANREFAEIGVNSFPETWDAYRDVGKKLKAKGTPLGQALGQSFGDPPTFAYPFLWSFGGAEVDDKGAVIINSKESVEAVKYMTAMWKDSFDEGGLAWDDASNNRAFLAGTISSTPPPSSAVAVIAQTAKASSKTTAMSPI